MDAINAIEQIEQDFSERNEPFDNIEFPEERLLEEIKVQAGPSDEPIYLDKEERLQVLSAFSMLDYNRDANQLVDKLLELHDRHPNWFDAWKLNVGESIIQEEFEDIGFRYPSRDAATWKKNSRILLDNYSGKWSELLLETGCDAVRLVERLEDDDFNVLKGVKVAPMYTRFIDQYVADMSSLWRLDIPVDTHIRKLSTDLFQAHFNTDTEPNDGKIRAFWLKVAEEHNVDRHVVDGGLWQIGNNWDEWGEDYWEEVTSE